MKCFAEWIINNIKFISNLLLFWFFFKDAFIFFLFKILAELLTLVEGFYCLPWHFVQHFGAVSLLCWELYETKISFADQTTLIGYGVVVRESNKRRILEKNLVRIVLFDLKRLKRVSRDLRSLTIRLCHSDQVKCNKSLKKLIYLSPWS